MGNKGLLFLIQIDKKNTKKTILVIQPLWI
jgi:hypothetical protein